MKGRAGSAAAAASGALRRRRRRGGGRRCRCHGDPAAGARGAAGDYTGGRRRRRTSGAAAAPPPPAAPPLGDSNLPRDTARRRRVTRPRPATGSVAIVTRSGPEGPGPGAALPRPPAGNRPRPRAASSGAPRGTRNLQPRAAPQPCGDSAPTRRHGSTPAAPERAPAPTSGDPRPVRCPGTGQCCRHPLEARSGKRTAPDIPLPE